jgi:ATP-dependent RNA helicase DeaD
VIDDIERVEVDEEEIAPFMEEVQKRWAWLDKEDLIKRVLSREFGRFLQYYANAPEIETVSGSEKGEKSSRRKSDHTPEEGYTRLFLNVGKIDKMYAREIMGLINTNVKGDKVEIGRIDLMKSFAFVEVKNEDADRVIKAMKHGVTIKGRSVVVDRSEPAQGKSEGNRKSAGRKKEEIRGKKEEVRGKKEEVRGKKEGRKKGAKKERTSKTTQIKKFEKADWMKFLHPEEGWARRRPKKK